MNLNFQSTKLQRVKDIEIPDIFNRRMKTGINKIDVLFDDGILPGSAATLTAKAGCGKTTFMLQMLDGLSKNGYNVGYFSGEESIYQLAYTAKRVNACEVPVANTTDIDQIKSLMKDLDLIVIDSFQALTSKTKMNTRQLEKYAVQTLTRHAKVHECTIIFIMHLTKSGDLKGGTIVPHTVDANLKIDRITDSDNDDDRVIYFEKNRFGPLNELECAIGRNGYDFDAQVVKSDDKAASKTNRKNQDHDDLVSYVNYNNRITITTASQMMGNNPTKAYSRLRDLVISGKLEKVGRGTDAEWILTELESARQNELKIAAEKR
jgi:predicted ATP-dependent serine protease